MQNHCTVCGNHQLDPLLSFPEIPVFVNVSAACREDARSVIRGTQDLVQCSRCGFVFNRAFEANKVCYGADYHAERGLSDYYRRHMQHTIELIDSVRPLKGKRRSAEDRSPYPNDLTQRTVKGVKTGGSF